LLAASSVTEKAGGTNVLWFDNFDAGSPFEAAFLAGMFSCIPSWDVQVSVEPVF
jgi:hypothetical protein